MSAATATIPHFDELVSSTSLRVGYQMFFTNLPLSEKIFKVLTEHYYRELSEQESIQNAREYCSVRTVYLESRYRKVHDLIKQVGGNNFFDLGAGISPLATTLALKGFNCVELDFAPMIETKKWLLSNLCMKHGLRTPKLFLEKGNILNFRDLARASHHFKTRNVTYLTSGVDNYKDFEKKELSAKNIWNMTQVTGGCWINTIELSDVISELGQIDNYLSSDDKIGIQFSNLFKNVSHAREFYEDLGFRVEVVFLSPESFFL